MNLHPDDIDIQEYAQGPGMAQGHISRCPECLERVEQYRRLFAALDREEIPPAPLNLADRVMARLPAKAIPPTSGWKIPAAMVLSATGGITGLLMLPGAGGWYLQLQAHTLALLAVGGAGLAVFLIGLQWRHYRKTVRLIKNSKILQPKY